MHRYRPSSPNITHLVTSSSGVEVSIEPSIEYNRTVAYVANSFAYIWDDLKSSAFNYVISVKEICSLN